MSDLRSLAETAAFFDVSQPTLKRWIDDGCPVAERGSNGVAYQLDLRAVADWRKGRQEAEAAADRERAERDAQLRLELLGPEALTAQGGAEALSARQRADALAAEVSRTRLAQLRGELTPTQPLTLALAEVLALLKTQLRQIPDLIAPELGLSADQTLRVADLVDDALAAAADAVEKLLDGMDDAARPH